MPYYRSRKYRRRYSKQFDKSARSILQKTGVRTTESQTLVNKTWRTVAVTMPAYGSAINARDTQMIYVAGLDIDFTFHNTDTPNDGSTIEVHFALVQSNADTWEDGTAYRDFFRDYDITSVDRGLDFTNLAINNAWDGRYLSNPINSHKFRTIFHKRFWLGPASDIGGQLTLKESTWMKRFNFYVPVKRVFNFDDVGDNVGDKPLAFIIWWMHPAIHQHTTATDNDSLCYTYNYNVVWKPYNAR